MIVDLAGHALDLLRDVLGQLGTSGGANAIGFLR